MTEGQRMLALRNAQRLPSIVWVASTVRDIYIGESKQCAEDAQDNTTWEEKPFALLPQYAAEAMAIWEAAQSVLVAAINDEYDDRKEPS